MPFLSRPILSLGLAICLVLLPVVASSALETETLGSLAVALEPEVAKQLKLTDEQQQALWRVVDRQEQKSMELVMKYGDLSRDERVKKFAPFRAETEAEVSKLLKPGQQKLLSTLIEQRNDVALQPAADEPVSEQPATTVKEETVVRAAEVAHEVSEDSEPVADALEKEPSQKDQSPRPTADGKFTFNFRNQPWADVLNWFAESAELSLVVDTPPPGVLNYRDDREYTPAQALDVLNGVLLTKGYTLVRKDRMLLVIDLEQGVPPNVVTDVPLSELEIRGEYELVRVLFHAQHSDPEAVAEELRRLIGPQGSVVVLPAARMLQVTETAGRLRLMQSVFDAAELAASPVETLADETVLQVYPTEGADSESTLKVLQTLMADSPVARVAADELTGNLVVLATPEEHKAIQVALETLRQDGRRVELIELKRVSATSAALVVERLFNPNAKSDKPNLNAPQVQADRASQTLLVRGTTDQINQIRTLVEKLDQVEPLEATLAGGTLRTIPLPSAHAQETLEQLRKIWPTLRNNPLTIVPPPAPIPVYRPGVETDAQQDLLDDPAFLEQLYQFNQQQESNKDRSARANHSQFFFASEGQEANSNTDDSESPILIVPGPGSTVIASEDSEALDLIEDIVYALGGTSGEAERQYAVFYLKYSDALTATTMLQAIFGGESGGDNLMGDLAGAAIGGAGGDLVGGLLGMGSGGASSGFSALGVDLVPIVRLNALIVNATPRDLETINQLLRVIDSPRGPDRVEASGKTRLIKVYNAPVEDVANVVRQVFADRIDSGGSTGQPNPRDILRALKGDGKSADDQEPEKMSIGVDERSRSIVVRSSEPLYEEVKQLVEQLDSIKTESKATRIVSLESTNSAALQQTLISLLGENARVSTTSAQSGRNNSKQSSGSSSSNSNSKSTANAERQRQETMRQIEGMRRFQDMIRRAREQRERSEQRGRGGQSRGGRPPGR